MCCNQIWLLDQPLVPGIPRALSLGSARLEINGRIPQGACFVVTVTRGGTFVNGVRLGSTRLVLSHLKLNPKSKANIFLDRDRTSVARHETCFSARHSKIKVFESDTSSFTSPA
jgi:hypothetical protein